MLEKYADKGKGPWEVYAWCVREAMAKHAGIKTLDHKLSFEDKKKYVSLMNGWKDKVEINGKVWEYRGEKPVLHDKGDDKKLD